MVNGRARCLESKPQLFQSSVSFQKMALVLQMLHTGNYVAELEIKEWIRKVFPREIWQIEYGRYKKRERRITDDEKVLGLQDYKIGQDRNEKCEGKLFWGDILICVWIVCDMCVREESGEGESWTQLWV